jgi:hypothetical protein
MKPKLGRPTLPKTKARRVWIAARFTPAEARAVYNAIMRENEKKSKWIRDKLLSASKRKD